MRCIDETSKIVSAVLDLREVPLTDMLTAVTLDKALQRMIPNSPTTRVSVAAFNSAI
jgi:hypothetical protein